MHAACLLRQASIRHFSCPHRRKLNRDVIMTRLMYRYIKPTVWLNRPSCLRAAVKYGTLVHSSTSKFVVRPGVISVHLRRSKWTVQ